MTTLGEIVPGRRVSLEHGCPLMLQLTLPTNTHLGRSSLHLRTQNPIRTRSTGNPLVHSNSNSRPRTRVPQCQSNSPLRLLPCLLLILQSAGARHLRLPLRLLPLPPVHLRNLL